jgi:hypothetical protein
MQKQSSAWFEHREKTNHIINSRVVNLVRACSQSSPDWRPNLSYQPRSRSLHLPTTHKQQAPSAFFPFKSKTNLKTEHRSAWYRVLSWLRAVFSSKYFVFWKSMMICSLIFWPFWFEKGKKMASYSVCWENYQANK